MCACIHICTHMNKKTVIETEWFFGKMALPFIHHLYTTSAWQQRPDSLPELVATQHIHITAAEQTRLWFGWLHHHAMCSMVLKLLCVLCSRLLVCSKTSWREQNKEKRNKKYKPLGDSTPGPFFSLASGLFPSCQQCSSLLGLLFIIQELSRGLINIKKPPNAPTPHSHIYTWSASHVILLYPASIHCYKTV